MANFDIEPLYYCGIFISKAGKQREKAALTQVSAFKYRGIGPSRDQLSVGFAYLFLIRDQKPGKFFPLFQIRVLGQLFFQQVCLDDQMVIQLGIHGIRETNFVKKLCDGFVFFPELSCCFGAVVRKKNAVCYVSRSGAHKNYSQV